MKTTYSLLGAAGAHMLFYVWANANKSQAVALLNSSAWGTRISQ